jgi:hypothetical protein
MKFSAKALFLNFFLLCCVCICGWARPFMPSPSGDTLIVRESADTLYRYRVDTVRSWVWSDSAARRRAPSLRLNLAYAAIATPNLGFEIPLGKHFTIGANAGLKPWPRWLPGDTDPENPKKWKHFLIAPEFRWWTDEVYEKWFVGADLIYIHYNAGSLRFPFGLYPEIRDNRYQGDFYGIGAFVGRSWYLSDRLRLETEIGIGAGYKKADIYECGHCGARIGQTTGPVLLPKIGVNLAYDFDRRRTRKELIDIIQAPFDTLVRPREVPPPSEFRPRLPEVQDRGVAGELAPKHPVLRHSSEYRPYTPDRILRKEEGALYVFFELDKIRLLRSFSEGGYEHDNGATLDEIIDITTRIMADTTSSVSRIQIVGLASVEGPIPHNTWLADERALALQRYIQERLAVPDSLFDTVGGGEAWSEFRDMVQDALIADGGDSGLTVDQLRTVLDIMDTEPDANRREARLKRLQGGKVYRILLQNVLHNLRNSGYLRIYYDYVPDRSAQEINEAIGLIEAGDSKAALQILERKRGDNRSDNAYAVALFYDGRENEALQVLEAAAARGDEAAARNLAQLQSIREQRASYEAWLREMEAFNGKTHNNNNL